MSDVATRLNAALEGRYAIERELGEGGMATVFLADDLKHERKVALKVLKPELAAVVGAERFLAEIKTTANLQHPHILPLFDSGEADTFLYYVMPYVQGESLQERLDYEKQLPVDEAVRITIDLAEALDYAHRQGVIHRDMKPANVLIVEGRPVIADFGIALAIGAAGGGRLTETGLSVGTPHYMSPEQATGDQAVGPRSDTYALACVLYEMLVGEPPHTGSTVQAIIGKIIAAVPESVITHRRTVPKNVDDAIARALEKVPADRFTGAHDFAEALADPSFRHGAPVAVEVAVARPPAPRSRPPRRRQRRGPAVPLAFATGLAIGLVALVVMIRGSSGPLCTWHEPTQGDAEGTRRISCDLQNVELEDLLAELSESLGMSIVSGEGGSALLNANIQNQEWRAALDLILAGEGLVAEEDPSGGITVTSVAALIDRELYGPTVSVTYQINDRDVLEMYEQVGTVLTERAQTNYDTGTRTLTVVDVPRVHDAIRELLLRLDPPPAVPDSAR